MDIVFKDKRKQMMSAVKSKDTKGEVEIRTRLHRMGLRYSLHQRRLPGIPDMVFNAQRAIIFVHGCFWHQHSCPRSKLPKTNMEWWKSKLLRNKVRDKQVLRELKKLGWRVLVIWECAFRGTGERTAIKFDEIANKAYGFIAGKKRTMVVGSSS